MCFFTETDARVNVTVGPGRVPNPIFPAPKSAIDIAGGGDGGDGGGGGGTKPNRAEQNHTGCQWRVRTFCAKKKLTKHLISEFGHAGWGPVRPEFLLETQYETHVSHARFGFN